MHESNRRIEGVDWINKVTLFAVDSDTQGKGLGKKLLNLFIGTSRKENIKTTTLETNAQCNFKFYERYGFVRTGIFFLT